MTTDEYSSFDSYKMKLFLPLLYVIQRYVVHVADFAFSYKIDKQEGDSVHS